MTKEESEKYYELLGFEYVAMSRSLFDNDLVDDEWREEQRNHFFARLAQKHKKHGRRVWEYEQTIEPILALKVAQRIPLLSHPLNGLPVQRQLELE